MDPHISCNVFLNVALVAVFQTIAQPMNSMLMTTVKTDRKQCKYDYATGHKALKRVHEPTELGVRSTGHYTIEQAHVNGMLTIELHPVSLDANIIPHC